MAIGDVIVGIDIETSKVSCCLGQINKFNQVEILNSATSECDGFKKGKYESTDSIARAIRFAISDIEKEQNFVIQSAYVNILGKYVNIYNTRYGIELEDKYAGVTQENIDAIIVGVSQVEIPEDYQIIDIIPTSFITDTKVTNDPIGIFTKTLSADVDIITAPKEVIKQIGICMQKAGLEIDGIVIDGFAMSNLVIEDEELKNGVLLLDVEDENIDISAFKGGSLLYTDSLPVGGNTITNDIALVLEISLEEAEKLKKQYGLSDSNYIDNDYNIKLTSYYGESKQMSAIKCSDLVSIIEARIKDIFGVIYQSLIDNKLIDEVKTCIITGQGFSNINKLDKTAQEQFNMTVRIGNAKVANLIKQDAIKSYGIVKYIAGITHTKNIGSSVKVEQDQSIIDSTVRSIKRAFSGAFSKKRK